MGNYSMPRYFQNMPTVGKPVRANAENVAELRAIEDDIHAHVVEGLNNGKADEAMNAKGQLTAMQRIALLVDPGTWCPLNSLYNPEHNKTGTTSIVKGLGRVNGKWCCIIASDNKKHAGTWVPGQADNLLRGSDTAKRLRIPLIYLLECAGVELDQQEKVYPNRRGGGTPFYRNSELNQMGVPVIVGIHGTNPAGGGYHSISPTVLIAHEKANMAVGGAGIVGGMNPKPHVDMEAALAQIEATKGLRADPPGSVSIHYGQTGFFREVCPTQEGVIATIKKYVDMLPSYDLEFFRVDTPQSPAASDVELYDLVLNNKNRAYDMYSVIARLFDGSQFMEYKKGYGPEMITGIAKVDGLLVGVVATGVSLVIGVAYGLVSGYAGGRLDALMMRLVDVLFALPFIVLVIIFSLSVEEPARRLTQWVSGMTGWSVEMVSPMTGLIPLFIAIGALGWLTLARIVRTQTMELKGQEFVEAARSLGIGHMKILFRHIAPNLFGAVIVYTTLAVPGIMLLEAVLSFLGLGVKAPNSSWGTLIKEGADRMEVSPELLLFPALLFSATLLALNFLGDGLRDALDPKSSRD